MIAYLDTSVMLWLIEGNTARISPRAQDVLREATLLLSPMVLLELQYLFEVGRSLISPRGALIKLRHEIDLQLCELAFPLVIEAALEEVWTREPFDRLIVAHARANGYAALVTSDAKIREHYPMAVW